MSHLVVHVLSETQLVFGDAHFDKVEVDPPDEVSQDGVVDDSLSDSRIKKALQRGCPQQRLKGPPPAPQRRPAS